MEISTIIVVVLIRKEKHFLVSEKILAIKCSLVKIAQQTNTLQVETMSQLWSKSYQTCFVT